MPRAQVAVVLFAAVLLGTRGSPFRQESAGVVLLDSGDVAEVPYFWDFSEETQRRRFDRTATRSRREQRSHHHVITRRSPLELGLVQGLENHHVVIHPHKEHHLVALTDHHHSGVHVSSTTVISHDLPLELHHSALPTSHAVVAVPAHPLLHDHHDIAVHHHPLVLHRPAVTGSGAGTHLRAHVGGYGAGVDFGGHGAGHGFYATAFALRR